LHVGERDVRMDPLMEPSGRERRLKGRFFAERPPDRPSAAGSSVPANEVSRSALWAWAPRSRRGNLRRRSDRLHERPERAQSPPQGRDQSLACRAPASKRRRMTSAFADPASNGARRRFTYLRRPPQHRLVQRPRSPTARFVVNREPLPHARSAPLEHLRRTRTSSTIAAAHSSLSLARLNGGLARRAGV
jgi:hypothetical protein